MSATGLGFKTSKKVFHNLLTQNCYSGIQGTTSHSTYSLEDLLGEVMVDERGLERQITGRVETVGIVLGRLHRRLVHSQQICTSNNITHNHIVL